MFKFFSKKIWRKIFDFEKQTNDFFHQTSLKYHALLLIFLQKQLLLILLLFCCVQLRLSCPLCLQNPHFLGALLRITFVVAFPILFTILYVVELTKSFSIAVLVLVLLPDAVVPAVSVSFTFLLFVFWSLPLSSVHGKQNNSFCISFPLLDSSTEVGDLGQRSY